MQPIRKQVDRREDHSCKRKIRLSSIAKVREAIKSIRSMNGRCDVEGYKCTFCGGYHLGKKLGAVVQRFRKWRI